jgi:hypothetical protein
MEEIYKKFKKNLKIIIIIIYIYIYIYFFLNIFSHCILLTIISNTHDCLCNKSMC